MAYVDVVELQRVLQKPSPTTDELAAMQRDIDVAAREIDWDFGFDPVDNPAPPPDTPEYGLLADVNLDRAVELWATHQRPFGAQNAGADMMPVGLTPRHLVPAAPPAEPFADALPDRVTTGAGRRSGGCDRNPARAAADPAH